MFSLARTPPPVLEPSEIFAATRTLRPPIQPLQFPDHPDHPHNRRQLRRLRLPCEDSHRRPHLTPKLASIKCCPSTRPHKQPS
ncbi:hypothetical protein Pdw03_3198 [Penicillium digitatum]|uniref:Uncharacterized protein n=1 Tax=Penicillium digitatum TaxID=36651 RepID=A0A7T6XFS8_PENDI|nr:hypothetical protein Pdw03_3198 [Penicillium digitatum]